MPSEPQEPQEQQQPAQPQETTQEQQPAQPQEPTAPQQPAAEAAPAQPTEPYAPAAQPTAPYGQPQAPDQPGAPTAAQPPFAGQPAAPGQQPVGYYQPVAPKTSGKATGALVCGIFAILLAWTIVPSIILGIVAIVLAVKAAKEAGKDGKATGGKVCGIIGIAFSVISLVMYMVLGLGVLAFMNSYSEVEPYSGSSTTLPEIPGVSGSEVLGEEDAIEAAASAELDKMKGKDAALVQKIAAEADESLSSSTGYSLTDLGVDPVAFVEWMLTDFSYQTNSVADFGDGTGSVDADVTVRDSLTFATTFVEDTQAALDAGQLEGMDEAAAKAKLGELFQAAMDKTTGTTTDYVTFDMVKVGDAWQVDGDSLESELDYLFGL